VTTRREQLRAIRRHLADLMDAGELVYGTDYPLGHGLVGDAWHMAYSLLVLAASLERARDRRGEAPWRTRADFCARELERFADWWSARAAGAKC
jgi:hypothetical protein